MAEYEKKVREILKQHGCEFVRHKRHHEAKRNPTSFLILQTSTRQFIATRKETNFFIEVFADCAAADEAANHQMKRGQS